MERIIARKTLERALGSEYEPIIYAALQSARAMVVLGTKAEHFNAVWVRNEWSRYRELIKKGARAAEFENALEKVRAIYEVGGKGHSVGIYSFNEDHIHRLALMAPVSRIMVRQPQTKANAGAFNNGMPMTSSLGCGTWGGNIVSENVHLKHYLNTTWVSTPIAEDKPSDAELFGDFYQPELEQ